MARRLRNKRMISYYAWFRKIRTPDYKAVAEIKGSNIITNDALFTERVQEICTMKLEHKPELSQNKLKYIIIDTKGNYLAKVDNSYNVYTMNDEYCGTIYNQFRFWFWLLLLLLIIMILLFLGISSMKKTGFEVKPKDIVISERDGNVIVDECNILVDYKGDKLIAPGRYMSYYFNVTNNNSMSVDVVFTMSDINEAQIPMVYRLIDGKQYVSGSATEWLPVEDVIYEFTLSPHQVLELRLDWHWEELDDEFDTRVGVKGDDIYTINLLFDITYR